MTNLEKIIKSRFHFKEALTLLNEIDIEDKYCIDDIIDTFGSEIELDGAIYTQLRYIEEDIIAEM